MKNSVNTNTPPWKGRGRVMLPMYYLLLFVTQLHTSLAFALPSDLCSHPTLNLSVHLWRNEKNKPEAKVTLLLNNKPSEGFKVVAYANTQLPEDRGEVIFEGTPKALFDSMLNEGERRSSSPRIKLPPLSDCRLDGDVLRLTWSGPWGRYVQSCIKSECRNVSTQEFEGSYSAKFEFGEPKDVSGTMSWNIVRAEVSLPFKIISAIKVGPEEKLYLGSLSLSPCTPSAPYFWPSNDQCSPCPEGKIRSETASGEASCRSRCEGLLGDSMRRCEACAMSRGTACRCDYDSNSERCRCIADGRLECKNS